MRMNEALSFFPLRLYASAVGRDELNRRDAETEAFMREFWYQLADKCERMNDLAMPILLPLCVSASPR